jgi:DNA repair exonuclease SbcCD ATPase subunit
MKIKTIDIKNFLALEQVTLDLQAPINIIAGPNEAGKSSIRDSIQWCLTGKARGLSTHEQQAAFIKDGAKAAEVTIIWEGDAQPTARKKTPKTPASVTGYVPDDQVMTSILCDPLAFLSLDDKARREVLFRLLPGLNPDSQTLAKRLALTPGVKGIIGEEVHPAWQVVTGLGHMAATEGFKAAETEAITRRRIAKRTRDDAQVEAPAQKATIGGVLRILPDIQASDVEAGLTTIRAERDKLQQARGKVEAQADKLPELEAALANLEAAPPDAPDPDRPVEDFVKALEINRGILEKCRAKVAAMTEGSDPKAFPDTCPVHNVECPSSRKVAVNGTKPQDVDPEKLDKAQADLAEQEKEVGLIEADLKAARTTQEVFDSYTQTHQALVDKIAKLKENHTQAQDTAAIDEQITALDLRMRTGYELLDAVREFWRKQEAAEAAVKKVADAEDEILLYDTLAKALAPDGIPSDLIREALGPVNERLVYASTYLFPDQDLLYLNEDLEAFRGKTPYSLLSKSARFRVGIAFQVTLAHLAGARILLIDEADLLDLPNRANLINFLLAIKEDFDCILCFATSDHADPSPTPDIQVWWIENGHIEQVNEKKAA